MIKIAPLAASQIIEILGGEALKGDPTGVEVSCLGEPADVDYGGLSFVISETYISDIPKTKAAVLVVQKAFADKALALLPSTVKVCIAAQDAYLGLAKCSEVIAKNDPLSDWRLSSAAIVGADIGSGVLSQVAIHPSAKIDPTVKIGPGAVICEGAIVGARTVILPNAVVGPGVVVGEDCTFFPGVVLYPRVRIGNRVRLHSNVVIGGDGFGYAKSPVGAVKIWHLGSVVIQDDVEVGPGTTIDKGTMKDSVVERGAKIDNQVQIGHNGHIKMGAILCAQTGLAGGVTVGRGAILAGRAAVADKVEIGDGAVLGPNSGATKDIAPGEVILGVFPGRPRREWWKMIALIDKLPDLIERVKKIEKGDSEK